jgi:AcrR family transcriptional regulator
VPRAKSNTEASATSPTTLKVHALTKRARKQAAEVPVKRRVGRPADTDPEQTRQDLLRAAMASFARDGYANSTLRGIAEEAGLTAGTLYHHFSTKSDLYSAVYQNAVDVATAFSSAAVADAVTLEEQLRALLTANVHLIDKAEPAPLFIARAWVDHPLDGTPSVPVESSARVMIDALVDAAIERGELPADEVDLWRPLVRAMVWGVTMVHLTGAYPADTVIDGLVTKVFSSTKADRRRRSRQ